jgi:KipI family sensor histidine kinase inhibitor
VKSAAKVRDPVFISGVRLCTENYGDSAVLASAITGDAEQRWRAVQRLADLLVAAPPTGFADVVATYDSVFVAFDPTVTTHREMVRALRATARRDGQGATVLRPRRFLVPVCFGGEYGPDLPAVAEELGLTVTEVISLHESTDWVVRFRGSPVCAPMMDGAPYATGVRRLPHPRTRVPAGSVAVAGRQAVIYPVMSPGGWRLIGRTPLRLVDVDRRPPVAYQPGDRLRFLPIDAAMWSRYADCWLNRSAAP